MERRQDAERRSEEGQARDGRAPGEASPLEAHTGKVAGLACHKASLETGGPPTIRTWNLQIRSLLLYPVELAGRGVSRET